MDHRLVDRIGGLVREDARRQAAHHLLDVVLVGGLEHVIVDVDVLAEKIDVLAHVLEQAADHGCQVDHVCGLVLVKDGLGLLPVAVVRAPAPAVLEMEDLRREPRCGLVCSWDEPEVAVLGGQKNPRLVVALAKARVVAVVDDVLNGLTDQAAAAGHQHDGRLRDRIRQRTSRMLGK